LFCYYFYKVTKPISEEEKQLVIDAFKGSEEKGAKYLLKLKGLKQTAR